MMKRFLPWLLCLMICVAVRADKVIVQDDFTSAGNPVRHDKRDVGSGCFIGSLPKGWKDNYVGVRDTKIEVESEIQREDDKSFMRFRVLRSEHAGTAARFYRSLPPLIKGKCYRLEFDLRNRSEGEFRIYFRENRSPYRAWGMERCKETGDWKHYRFDIRTPNAELQFDNTGLFFELDGKGLFDLRDIRVTELDGVPAAQNILDSVFTERLKPSHIDRRSEGLSAFDGVLPEPWKEDFTHWCKGALICAKTVNEQNEFYLRFAIEKVGPTSDFPGIMAPLPALSPGRTYEMSIRAANYTDQTARLSVRGVPHPYKVLAALVIPPEKRWGNYRYVFTVPEQFPASVGVYLNFDGVGTFDLAAVRLAESSSGESRLRRPSPDSPNYLANSCFPLGLPAGWNLDQWRCNGTVSADASVIGPSFTPALKLQIGGIPGFWNRELAIYSVPFLAAEPEKENTLSFSYRTTGRYRAILESQSGQQRAVLSLEPTSGSEWKRAVLPFRCAPDDDSVALHLIGQTGDLWLDAVRICSGKDSACRMQMENEVALGISSGDAALARIIFADEPNRISVWIAGKGESAELHWSVFDLYGKEHAQPPIRFDGKNRAFTADLQLPENRGLGQFRVEAQLFRNGKPCSPVSEFVITRIARPRYSGTAEAPADSPFGIHVNPYDIGLTAVKAAGCTWVRTHDAGFPCIGWGFLEKEPGKWTFQDEGLNHYRRYGLRILGELGFAPPWASYYKYDKDPAIAPRGYAPADREAFANFVRTVGARYRGVIDEWTFWNEPSLTAGWPVSTRHRADGSIEIDRGPDPAGEYAAFSKIAFEQLRKSAPQAKLVAHYADEGGWTGKLCAAGACDFCDGIEFHYYINRRTGFPGDGIAEMLRDKLGGLSPRHGKHPRLYMTEGQGASRGNDTGDLSRRYAGIYRTILPWKNEEDYLDPADNTVRYVIALLAHRVDKVFLYSAHCFGGLISRPNYLALVGADGYPHPMLAAYSAMTHRLEGKKFVLTKLLAPNVAAHIFSDGNSSVAAVTGDSLQGKYLLKCGLPGVEIADLFGNPTANPVPYEARTFYFSAPVPAETLAAALSLEKQ